MKCFVCRKTLEGNLIRCEGCQLDSLPLIRFKGAGWSGALKTSKPTYNDLVREKSILPGYPKD